MKIAVVALATAACALGSVQINANPLEGMQALGPAQLRSLNNVSNVLARISQSGLPPAVRPLQANSGEPGFIDRVPELRHVEVEMQVLSHGSELWIEPKP